jgi:5-deoxy-glucuronate isomerase
VRTVVSPGKDTDLIKLDVATVEVGDRLEMTADGEVLIVILSGVIDVEIGGAAVGRAGGRASVFEGPGDAVYAPPGSQLCLRATATAELAIASAPLADQPAAQARIIRAADQDAVDRGAGNWSRTVRNILGPDAPAGRLLVGETVNPPGNWSSYPPHKHDEQDPPREVQLEEVYLFKFDPPGGFGVQVLYDSEKQQALPIHDNDAAVIKSGYHPVVGAPGYSLYYLWVMAGQGRQMIPYLDPRHAWVQESG